MQIPPPADLPLVADYHAARREWFPSDSSIDWFMRRNRRALVRDGALVMIAGRLRVRPDRFDVVVLAVGASALETA